jgi:Zn-dependent M32 family carboxypeptidase
MGNNILFFKDSDKLISVLANYLKDACQEVRAYSKKAFLTMQNTVMGQNDLEKLLQRVLNEVQYKKVKGFLDTEALHPTEFLSHVSAQRQTDFVIKTAKNQHSAIQLSINNGTPTSALMAGVGTPGSMQGTHIALG